MLAFPQQQLRQAMQKKLDPSWFRKRSVFPFLTSLSHSLLNLMILSWLHCINIILIIISSAKLHSYLEGGGGNVID